MTEQKKIERERLNAILMTEQQSIRIKADDVHKTNMTSFVSFVCHELRNPLQGVTSSAEFLHETLERLEALTSKLSKSTNGVTTKEHSPAAMKRVSLGATRQNQSNRLILQPLSDRHIVGEPDSHIVGEMESLLLEAKQLIGNIQTCAAHQALITNNVLDLSRLDAGKVEPASDVIDVQALGRQIVEMMSARAQHKRINLSMTEVRSWPLFIKGDATILRQVLLNLVSNAIKFTSECGTITVDLYASSPNRLGQITLHGSVTDDGLGMSQAEQERLFQRFSQANRKVAQLYGGSGLGLSISKELVRVMGGEMKVKSVQGKGSTFCFTSVHDRPSKEEIDNFLRQISLPNGRLPAALVPSEPDLILTKINVDSLPPKFRMIGVAEDNPINLQHLARHLKMLGYESTLCVNGQEIINKFCEPDSIIDCCILDMSMPVVDGLQAVRLMRQHESSRMKQGSGRPVPIIALSGNALKEQVTAAMSAGCNDYLIKPCKRSDLARTLSRWERIVHTGA